MPTSRSSKARAVRPGDRAPKGLLLSPQAAQRASGVEIVRWSPSASTANELLPTGKAPWLDRCQSRAPAKIRRRQLSRRAAASFAEMPSRFWHRFQPGPPRPASPARPIGVFATTVSPRGYGAAIATADTAGGRVSEAAAATFCPTSRAARKGDWVGTDDREQPGSKAVASAGAAVHGKAASALSPTLTFMSSTSSRLCARCAGCCGTTARSG